MPPRPALQGRAGGRRGRASSSFFHRGGDESQMVYTESYRSSMVRRMTGRGALSATALARETGVAQATLSRWLLAAGNVKPVGDSPKEGTPPRRPQDWSPAEILDAVAEASRLGPEELGTFLRRRGLHEAQLKEWRECLVAALGGGKGRKGKSKGTKAQSRRISDLERELRRKEKALAEAAALLVLQKKVREIWGDEDGGTKPRSDS